MAQYSTEVRLNPADEMIQVGKLQIRFLVTGAQSNGSVAVFELTVPAGEKLPAPAHSHDAYEETLYGLEGVTTWTVDDVSIEVGPGQVLCIPRGAVHTFANHGTVDAKSLAVLSPAVIGPEFFREMGAVIDAAGGTPDRTKMAEVMLRHGLTPGIGPGGMSF
ncbi:MAG TPA: cupin domain-containing protein [Ktedonobacteraceae bacterium]|jgi:quercetin dioxygenase-like cupin family protein|nr:cupin domain-containing protein [Ktedonobacteraceae bacterium]HZU68939.1 cupin domain-containing protein [Ktedonobacteraceae bacterium]